MTGLRYSMKGGILRVERDTPYIKSYPVDFLNLDRDSDSAVSLSTNVLSGGGGGSSGGGGGSSGSSGGSGGLTTGSTSSVKTKSSGDFWKALETGVQQILAYQEPQHLSVNVLQAEPGASPSAAATNAALPSSPAPASPSAPGAAGVPADVKNRYTLNRQAGVLTVNATDHQQELIQRYIEGLKKNASAQVLIEAKILEVDLNDQYASGVDWSTVGTRLGSILGGGNITTQFSLPTPANPIVGVNPSTSFVQFAASSTSSNIVKMLSAFGTLRTLSSPRLHAINNQQSTLTFATNHVYFTLTVTPATTTAVNGVSQTPATPTVTSSINTVPIGIMMTMMPSIDIGSNEVTLSVRPTLSTITDFVNDPGFELQLAQAAPTMVGTIHNAIPEIQVRELDSTLKLKSGQTMVIGGLMQQEATNTDNGVPFVSGVPLVGNLFKNVAKSSHNKELVLLIKATIVDVRGSFNNTDRNLFHKFSDDPRPVSF
jgi:general secretion pathway protein D